MKKKLKRSIILTLIICIVAYGYYIYRINTDNPNINNDRNSSRVGMESENITEKEDDMDSTIVESDENLDGTVKSQDIATEESKQSGIQEQQQQQQQEQQENLDIIATSALLMDASNNRVLYEKNGYQVMPMASTTKIMTLIVILENANLEDVVTVSSKAARMPDVQLNINTGEQYILKDLIYSLMLESHNDSAVALAEHVGGSVEGFAAMMTAKAKELGCTNTQFVTPNGLDADGHYTTAADLGLIASYGIKNEKFLEITNTPSYSFSEVNGKRTCTVNNKNSFLNRMEGAIGVKTGFTGKAGYCFVGALKKDGKTFISVVLACGWPPNKSYKWHDTQILMNYGLGNYSMNQIKDNNTLTPIFVVDGQQNQVTIDAQEKNIELLLRNDETTRVEYNLPEYLTAPVKENELVGSIKYYVNEELYDETPIYTTGSVKQIDFKYCFRKIFKIWRMGF